MGLLTESHRRWLSQRRMRRRGLWFRNVVINKILKRVRLKLKTNLKHRVSSTGDCGENLWRNNNKWTSRWMIPDRERRELLRHQLRRSWNNLIRRNRATMRAIIRERHLRFHVEKRYPIRRSIRRGLRETRLIDRTRILFWKLRYRAWSYCDNGKNLLRKLRQKGNWRRKRGRVLPFSTATYRSTKFQRERLGLRQWFIGQRGIFLQINRMSIIRIQRRVIRIWKTSQHRVKNLRYHLSRLILNRRRTWEL